MKKLTNNQDPDGVESVPVPGHLTAILTLLSMANAAGGHSSRWKALMSFLPW